MKQHFMFEKVAGPVGNTGILGADGRPQLPLNYPKPPPGSPGSGMTTLGAPLPPGAAAPALNAYPQASQTQAPQSPSVTPQMADNAWQSSPAPAAKVTVPEGPAVTPQGQSGVAAGKPSPAPVPAPVPAPAPVTPPVQNFKRPLLTSEGAVRGGRAGDQERISQNQVLGRQAEQKLSRTQYDPNVFFTAPEMRYLVQTGKAQFDQNARSTAGYSDEALKEDHQVWRNRAGLKDDPGTGRYGSELPAQTYAQTYDADIQNQNPATRLQSHAQRLQELWGKDWTPENHEQKMQGLIAFRLNNQQELENRFKSLHLKNKELEEKAKVMSTPDLEAQLKNSRKAVSEAQNTLLGIKNGGEFDKAYQNIMSTVNEIKRTAPPEQQRAVIEQAMGPGGWKRFNEFFNQYQSTYSGNTDQAYLAKLRQAAEQDEKVKKAQTGNKGGSKPPAGVPGGGELMSALDQDTSAGQSATTRGSAALGERGTREGVVTAGSSEEIIQKANEAAQRQQAMRIRHAAATRKAFVPRPDLPSWAVPNMAARMGDNLATPYKALRNVLWRGQTKDSPDNNAGQGDYLAEEPIARMDAEDPAGNVQLRLSNLKRVRASGKITDPAALQRLDKAIQETMDEYRRLMTSRMPAGYTPPARNNPQQTP